MELITVLVILSVMAALIIPSLTGFIEKAKQQKYVMEAQSMRRSIEMYVLDTYDYGTEINAMYLLLDLTSAELDSPDHPLAGYMTVQCTKGAAIKGLTLKADTLQITGLIYRVNGYRIEIENRKVTVTRPDGW